MPITLVTFLGRDEWFYFSVNHVKLLCVALGVSRFGGLGPLPLPIRPYYHIESRRLANYYDLQIFTVDKKTRRIL